MLVLDTLFGNFVLNILADCTHQSSHFCEAQKKALPCRKSHRAPKGGTSSNSGLACMCLAICWAGGLSLRLVRRGAGPHLKKHGMSYGLNYFPKLFLGWMAGKGPSALAAFGDFLSLLSGGSTAKCAKSMSPRHRNRGIEALERGEIDKSARLLLRPQVKQRENRDL